MFLGKTPLSVQPEFGNNFISLKLDFFFFLIFFSQYMPFLEEVGKKYSSVLIFNPVLYCLPGTRTKIITADFNALFDQTRN